MVPSGELECWVFDRGLVSIFNPVSVIAKRLGFLYIFFALCFDFACHQTAATMVSLACCWCGSLRAFRTPWSYASGILFAPGRFNHAGQV